MTLGERLKENRLYHGLKQSEVAEKLGINYRTLSGWEHDVSSPGIEDLLRLSEIYETSIYSLMGKPAPEIPFGKAMLSAMDMGVIEDYHNLPPHAKEIVDLIFRQYRHFKEKETAV